MLKDDVSGLDVFAALRAQDESVRVVFATADTEGATRLRLLAAGACGVLAKPFSAAQLTTAVGAALASQERGPRCQGRLNSSQEQQDYNDD